MALRGRTSSFLRTLAWLVPATSLSLGGVALVHCGSSSDTTDGGAPPGPDATSDVAADDTAAPDTGGGGFDANLNDTGGGDLDAADAADAADTADANFPDATPPPIPCMDAGDDAEGGTCSGALTCCSSLCVDLLHDPRNCGVCGNGCTATQFCGGVACNDAVFTNVCMNSSATVMTDQYDPDNEAGVSLATALGSCTDGGVTITIDSQTQAGLDPNTGRPLVSQGTLVAGGGEFGQLAVGYLNKKSILPAYATTDGTTAWIYQRSTGQALVTTAVSALTPHHDYFIMQLAVEPISGTLVLNGWGLLEYGTNAGAYYGSQVMIPNHDTYTSAFYVYEWTDTNNDGVPNDGDTFDLKAQG